MRYIFSGKVTRMDEENKFMKSYTYSFKNKKKIDIIHDIINNLDKKRTNMDKEYLKLCIDML